MLSEFVPSSLWERVPCRAPVISFTLPLIPSPQGRGDSDLTFMPCTLGARFLMILLFIRGVIFFTFYGDTHFPQILFLLLR